MGRLGSGALSLGPAPSLGYATIAATCVLGLALTALAAGSLGLPSAALVVPLAGLLFAWGYAFGLAHLPAMLLGTATGAVLLAGALAPPWQALRQTLCCAAAGGVYRAWLARRTVRSQIDRVQGLLAASLLPATATGLLALGPGNGLVLGELVGLLAVAPALILTIDRLASGAWRGRGPRLGELAATLAGALAVVVLAAAILRIAEGPADALRLLPMLGLVPLIAGLACGYAPASAVLLVTVLVAAHLVPAGDGTAFQVALVACSAATLVAAAATGDRRRERQRLDRAMRERTQELEVANRKLAHQAATDALTGLLNRRAFTALAEAHLAAGRGGALLFLDLDHFKTINDRYGHAAGDMALAEVAATVRRQVRACDLAGRWGGEELVLLLDASAPADASACAERIRSTVASCAAVPAGGRVSVSIGIALIQPGERLGELVRRADRALYAAKRGGRNRCVLAAAA